MEGLNRNKQANIDIYSMDSSLKKKKKYIKKSVPLNKVWEIDNDQMSEPAGKRARVEWFQGLHTLRPHPEKAKLFQIRGRDKKTTEDSQNKIHHAETENQFEDSEGSLGKLVWGCIGDQRWWPAMVIHSDLCGCRPAKAGHLWVFWFGDHKISEVLMSKTVDFIENFTQKIGKSVSGKLYKEALSEVLQECVRRTGLECLKNLITWALNGFTGFTKIMLSSRPGEAIPSSILVHLDSIAEDMQESDQSMKKADSKVRRDVIQVDSTRRRCPYPSSSSSSDMRDFGSPATKFSPQDMRTAETAEGTEIKNNSMFDQVSDIETDMAEELAVESVRGAWFQGLHTLRPHPTKTQLFQVGHSVETTSDGFQRKFLFSPGQLVWSCLGRKRLWPAMIIQDYCSGLGTARRGYVWVFWFGDHTISDVLMKGTIPFIENFSQQVRKRVSGKLYKEALSEVLEECVRRTGLECTSIQFINDESY